MPEIVTSLSANYQKSSWSLTQAVRELIANAIDAEIMYKGEGRGQMELEYRPRSKVLSIVSKGIVLSARVLAMGTSTSRDNDEAIGQFGEGLPMALLVCARSGQPLTIYTGDEKWVPKIGRPSEYDNEPMLVIETRKMIKPREDFTIELGEIEETDWNFIKGFFLKMDPKFQTYTSVKLNDNQHILLDPAHKGRIYCKGVYICTRERILYGYNLNLELNRDRSMVDSSDLRRKISTALDEAVNTASQEWVSALARRIGADSMAAEAEDSWSDLSWNMRFKSAILADYAERWGEDYVPVSNTEDAKSVESLGGKPALVSPMVAFIVNDSGKFTRLADLQKMAEAEVDETLPISHPYFHVILPAIHSFLAKLSLNTKVSSHTVVRFKHQKFPRCVYKDGVLLVPEALVDQGLGTLAGGAAATLFPGRENEFLRHLLNSL